MAKPVFSLRSSRFFTASLAFTALLYLTGLVAFFLLQLRANSQASENWYEQVPLLIELREDAPEPEIQKLQKYIEQQDYLRPNSLVYVPKKEAFRLLAGDFSEEELEVLGENPMPNIIEFKIQRHAAAELQTLSKQLEEDFEIVEAVLFLEQEEFIRPQAWGGLFLLSFLLIASLFYIGLTLLYSNLELLLRERLAFIQVLLYAGSSKDYILAPYQVELKRQALGAAFWASLLLFATWLFLRWQIPEIGQLIGFFYYLLVVVFLFLLSTGIFRFAYKRSLQMHILPLFRS